MLIQKNIALNGSANRKFLLDVFYLQNGEKKPVVIFCHGFKGFKDWGHFNLVGERFAEEGCVFVKFNFSHNGTTPEDPLNFTDLKAFGNNNFSKELEDLAFPYVYPDEATRVKETLSKRFKKILAINWLKFLSSEVMT